MTDQTAVVDVDAALKEFRDMMGADGYLLRWEPTEGDRIVVRIDATDGACADCLVPLPVMEAIMASALEPTPYTLDRVVLSATDH